MTYFRRANLSLMLAPEDARHLPASISGQCQHILEKLSPRYRMISKSRLHNVIETCKNIREQSGSFQCHTNRKAQKILDLNLNHFN